MYKKEAFKRFQVSWFISFTMSTYVVINVLKIYLAKFIKYHCMSILCQMVSNLNKRRYYIRNSCFGWQLDWTWYLRLNQSKNKKQNQFAWFKCHWGIKGSEKINILPLPEYIDKVGGNYKSKKCRLHLLGLYFLGFALIMLYL